MSPDVKRRYLFNPISKNLHTAYPMRRFLVSTESRIISRIKIYGGKTNPKGTNTYATATTDTARTTALLTELTKASLTS